MPNQAPKPNDTGASAIDKTKPDTQKSSAGVEGEGSYTATHRYEEGLKKSIAEGRSDELAQKAKEALDGPEGPELKRAEEIGKSGRIDPTKRPN